MRLAGHNNVFQVMAHQFGVPEPVSADRADQLMELISVLEERGFTANAAIEAATQMTEGEQPAVQPSLRFAQLHGTAPENAGTGDPAD